MDFLTGNQPQSQLLFLLAREPQAVARIAGSYLYPSVVGRALFYQTGDGTVIVTRLQGLPETASGIFAMHIHSGSSCTGTEEKPFANAGAHYNPDEAEHPYHRGDLPPLMGSDGHAWGAVLTGRFTVEEVLGRTAIIHLGPDDFHTQPPGNAGDMIACGVIEPV